MLFIEARFFVFFLLVLGVHWAIPSNTGRKVWLLLCSHFFYACFFIGEPAVWWGHFTHHEWGLLNEGSKATPDSNVGWWFPFVLIGSSCMDYAVGLGIADAKSEGKRKAWLLVSLGINLGVLCFFKYYNFFIGSASTFLHSIGLGASDWTLKIFLPYGVSFYTFQSMSYSIDVYRRRLEPVRKFLDLAFFIAFFPQVVAGPIVRAMTFLPQVFVKRQWANVDVRGALTLFFIGFVKKACVSSNVAPIADLYFRNPTKYTAFSAVIGVLFYAVQIYCDFSGYTDMAIATARLLGYELTINFEFPYFSRDITEFWRRWHISLSTWLRDYLYISLGGNRGSKLFTYRNLMLTMLLGGLWHGSSWNFVIWGGLHGAALIIHREWHKLTENAALGFKKVVAWICVPVTFYWVCVTWIFFRAQPLFHMEPKEAAPELQHKVLDLTGFQVAMTTLKSFTLFSSRGRKTFSLWCVALFAGLALVHWLCSRKVFATWWRRLPEWAYAALLGVGVALALFFMPTKYQPFIYFQF
jgi:alginate O-acetyltransferase complex protein AlgI